MIQFDERVTDLVDHLIDDMISDCGCERFISMIAKKKSNCTDGGAGISW